MAEPKPNGTVLSLQSGVEPTLDLNLGNEKKRLLTGCAEPCTVYYRRWYILFLFCMMAIVQGLGWATFGPITQSLKVAFQWQNSTIAIMELLGKVPLVIGAIPCSLVLIDKYLRPCVVAATTCVALGHVVRCVTSQPDAVTWTMGVGAVLLGCGCIVSFGAVTILSNVWFPPYQRTTATALSSMSNGMGVCLAFLIGPHWVPMPNIAVQSDGGTVANSTVVEMQRTAIMNVMYGEAGVAVLVLVLIWIYFPNKPPTAPSASATAERLNLGRAAKSLIRNSDFLLLLLALAAGLGVYKAFSVVLDIDVNHLGVTQMEAGWIGVYSIIGGIVASQLISRIADTFMKSLKLLIILMFIPSTAMFLWFTLIVEGFVTFSKASLYTAAIVPGIFSSATLPLFYELASEVTYPTGEGTTSLILSLVFMLSGLIFLGILSLPHIGVAWMNWVMLTLCASTLIITPFIRVAYHRTNLDIGKPSQL